jgi:ribonuclease HII
MDYFIGSDEAGLGAIAGPLVVCAVAAPLGWKGPKGLGDSKTLSPRKRAELYVWFQRNKEKEGLYYCLVKASSRSIDVGTIAKVLLRSHEEALRGVMAQLTAEDRAVRLVVDGTLKLRGITHEAIPKADSLFPPVSMASVIAKLKRDCIMTAMHDQCLVYGFAQHKGYPTEEHLRCLDFFGPCAEHRRSYAPVKAIIEKRKP